MYIYIYIICIYIYILNILNLPSETPISSGFPIATFDYRRVYLGVWEFGDNYLIQNSELHVTCDLEYYGINIPALASLMIL